MDDTGNPAAEFVRMRHAIEVAYGAPKWPTKAAVWRRRTGVTEPLRAGGDGDVIEPGKPYFQISVRVVGEAHALRDYPPSYEATALEDCERTMLQYLYLSALMHAAGETKVNGESGATTIGAIAARLSLAKSLGKLDEVAKELTAARFLKLVPPL